FEVTLAVLVVACPCALSLAIPTALASAHGALARIGVLAVRPDALDALARVDTVVFDKTGTLTCGTPTLAAVEVFDGITQSHALALARALEHDSRHPLAQVFRGHGDDEERAFGPEVPVQHIAGAGVEAQWQGRRWRLGHAMFAAGADDDGAIWLGDGERAWARFQVRDSLRPEA